MTMDGVDGDGGNVVERELGADEVEESDDRRKRDVEAHTAAVFCREGRMEVVEGCEGGGAVVSVK